MKGFKFNKISCGIIAVALLSIALSSCKGRTMENMEPTGDTVEVVIQQNPDAQ